MSSSEENTMSVEQRTGHHAIVIGGSFAGLFAARVLADYYETVTIVDRDIFPLTPEHRKGVPQSYHAHGLLATAFPIMEQLFPGMMNDMVNNGATVASNKVPIAIVAPKGLLPMPEKVDKVISFSRSLLEWHVRDQLSRRPQVRFVTNTEVTALLATADCTRVIGVEMRERGSQEGGTTTLQADLVVDASGRHSRTPQWLVQLEYEAVPTETINSDIRYASRFYTKPEQFPAVWQNLIVNGRTSHGRAGLILSVDHGRWHVTLAGVAGQAPPIDEEGFLEFARSLPDPSIYEALRVAQPLTPIRGYGTPQNHLRHFERMPRWPSGFIVTGDAVCAFNPIYGQGITVSAMDAMALKRCLEEQQDSPRADFERHFQGQVAKTVADPWLLGTNQDQRWPTVKLSGARPHPALRLLHGYMDLVLYGAVVDPAIARVYSQVVTLISSPRSLMQPRMVVRVLAMAGKRAVRRILGGEEEVRFALSPESLAVLRAQPAIQSVGVL